MDAFEELLVAEEVEDECVTVGLGVLDFFEVAVEVGLCVV